MVVEELSACGLPPIELGPDPKLNWKYLIYLVQDTARRRPVGTKGQLWE
jgi:hypothetical protein